MISSLDFAAFFAELLLGFFPVSDAIFAATDDDLIRSHGRAACQVFEIEVIHMRLAGFRDAATL
jgi:hypothetical protein